MSESAKVADLLEAAADRVRVFGHHQGDYWPGASSLRPGAPIGNWDNVPVCAVGALCLANSQSVLRFSEWDETFAEAVNALNDKINGWVSAWNDEPGRTADEVVELMLGVAKDFRNGEA